MLTTPFKNSPLFIYFMKTRFICQKAGQLFGEINHMSKLAGLVQSPKSGSANRIVPMVQRHIFGIPSAEGNGKHNI